MTATVTNPVTDIADTIDEMAEPDAVCVSDLLDRYGASAYAPAIFIPAIMLVSPLSGVPLLSSVLGFTIMLIALQGLIGRDAIWLPGWVRRQELSHQTAGKVSGLIRKFAEKLAYVTRERLLFLVTPPLRRVVYGVCAVSGMLMPFLEVVPFSSSVVGGSIAVVAVGLLARDGLIVLIGLICLILSFAVPFTLLAQFF